MDHLAECRVAVFGIGGVGGYVCEALARSGVGTFDLIDNDKVCLTNLNRQIIATRETVGQYKVDAMKERILAINPEAVVRTHQKHRSHRSKIWRGAIPAILRSNVPLPAVDPSPAVQPLRPLSQA